MIPRVKKLIDDVCATVGHQFNKGTCERCAYEDPQHLRFNVYEKVGLNVINPGSIVKITLNGEEVEAGQIVGFDPATGTVTAKVDKQIAGIVLGRTSTEATISIAHNE